MNNVLPNYCAKFCITVQTMLKFRINLLFIIQVQVFELRMVLEN